MFSKQQNKKVIIFKSPKSSRPIKLFSFLIVSSELFNSIFMFNGKMVLCSLYEGAFPNSPGKRCITSLTHGLSDSGGAQYEG